MAGRLLLFLLPLWLLVACGPPANPLQRDFQYTLEQVERQRAPRTRSMGRLLAAFDAAQSADYRAAWQLDSTAAADRWPELYTLYRDMHQRLAAVVDYFPLNAPTDYRGGYGLRELERRTEDARLASGQYYLARIEAGTRAARAGDKAAARRAYYDLEQALYFLPERGDVLTPLREELRLLGTVRVAVRITGEAELVTAAADLGTFDVGAEDDWLVIDFRDTGPPPDYTADLQLTSLSEYGPREDSDVNIYQEEVLDYIEKVEYEERINDSTVVTKVKEIEHYKIIEGRVEEITQSYSIHVSGELGVYDAGGGVVRFPERIRGTASWENEYSVCSGDRAALPAFACSGSSEWPPRFERMLERALDNLRYRTVGRLLGDCAPE